MTCSRHFRLAILLLLVVSHSAYAQSTTGTISGIITDTTGAVLPGVSVEMKHTEMGGVRSVVSDSEGRYRASNLAVGEYQVTAGLAGFQTMVRTGVTLTIGREAVVDLVLKVGQLTETVSVAGEVSLVNTKTSSVAGLVDQRAISSLPLSGRDFIQLALLEPSVLRIGNTDQQISKGFGTRTTFAGSRPRQNVFLMDGTNVNNFSNFAVPGSVAGVVLGVDTVREFQVLVGSYGAEYAGAGGTLSAITKSGTNLMHGSGFWFMRDDKLDAKGYFDAKKNDFSRHQFGGTVGGPVKRDRLFFFGSYEGLRDRLGITNVGIVPDDNARNGLLPDPANPGQLRNVGVHPNVKPFLELNPRANGRSFGDGFAEYRWTATEPTDQRYFVGKIDYRYAKASSVFVRYTLDSSEALKSRDKPLFVAQWSNRSDCVTAENRSVLSDRSIFVGRLGIVRSDIFGDDVVAPGQTFDENLVFIPGTPMGSATFIPGRDSSSPRTNTALSFQYNAQFVMERTRHSMKFGADVSHHMLEFIGISHTSGTYFFDSLELLLKNQPRRLQTRFGSDPRPERNVTMFVGGFFAQDDFRITPRVTLNAGLRYEPYSVPKETNGLNSTLKDRLDPTYTEGSQIFRNPSWKNFGPRLGFAWDVTGNGRLAVRGGGGLYHDILLPQVYRNNFSSSLPFSGVQNTDRPVNFPNAALDAKTAILVTPNPDGIEYNITQPRIYHFNLQAETQLAKTLVFTLGYVGSRGFHQVRIIDGNTAIPTVQADGTKFFPTNSVRRNPNFAGSWWRVTSGRSFYDGLRAKVTKRFSHDMLFGASYSLGNSVDDGSTDVGQTDLQANASLPQDPDDPLSSRGPSDFDVRHNFSAHFSAVIPWSSNAPGALGAVLGGWQLNGIASLSSGAPFTALIGFDNARTRSRANSQHPNLVAGYSSNPILGGPDQYFDPLAFSLPAAGTFGNLERNTLRGPGLAVLDMSLVKMIGVGRQRHMELRVEGFNILNRANFGRPAAVIFDAAGRVGNAGRITNTSTPGRQVQLGVKLVF
ncbi:MAG: TonB-dependent receptor [Vicinamibacterales bacterium]